MSDPAEDAKYKELRRLLTNLERFVPDEQGESGRDDGTAGRRQGPRALPLSDLSRLSLPAPREVRPVIADAQEVGDQNQNRALRRSEPPAGVNISPMTFVIATVANALIAAVLAVLITVGVTRQDAGREPSPAGRPAGQPGEPARTLESARDPRTVEQAVPSAPARPPGAAGDLPAKRPEQAIRSADLVDPAAKRTPAVAAPPPLRIMVDKPPVLQPGKPSTLPLRIEPEAEARGIFLLVMAGLPAGSLVAGATQIGLDTWLLDASAAVSLQLTVPQQQASGALDVGFELRRLDGSTAARGATQLAVLRPPPPPVAVETPAVKFDEATAQKHFQRGELFLDSGDVGAARQLFERAVDYGSARAALALGATYDPNRLWQLGILGMAGNKERARFWYERADQLGAPEAKSRLKELTSN